MGGVDALLSEEENCADEVEMPNELEVNHAFTPKMSHMLVVVSPYPVFARAGAGRRQLIAPVR